MLKLFKTIETALKSKIRSTIFFSSRTMQFVLFLCVSLTLAKFSFAGLFVEDAHRMNKRSIDTFLAQCSENPCQIGGEFLGPNYQCFQSTENPNNAICTCPDGQTQINRPCRESTLC